LRYWKPRIVQTEKTIKMVDAAGTVVEKDVIGEELRYYTIGSDKTTMVEESTYGGKLVENVTQAVARDLLAAATVRVDRHPDYELVMHVHDSLVAEVEAGAGDVEEFCRLISRLPPWAEGLPLVSHGYRDTRFRG
jgi:DNA polymerase